MIWRFSTYISIGFQFYRENGKVHVHSVSVTAISKCNDYKRQLKPERILPPTGFYPATP